VERRLIIETSVLVDLDRESRSGGTGRAHALVAQHADARLFVTATIAGELAAGTRMHDRSGWQAFLERFPWLPIDDAVAWHFGEIHRYLRRSGQLIGTNDLWIAAAGLAHGVGVMTRNAKEFDRVPGLEVIAPG
jgi:tRNA(fMet)-specific endonuclease VapC